MALRFSECRKHGDTTLYAAFKMSDAQVQKKVNASELRPDILVIAYIRLDIMKIKIRFVYRAFGMPLFILRVIFVMNMAGP